jgi:hypothetical protein
MTVEEKKIYQEFVTLFNTVTMESNLSKDQIEVVASLGVGVYRQAKLETERK